MSLRVFLKRGLEQLQSDYKNPKQALQILSLTLKQLPRLLILAYKSATFFAKGSCRYYPTCSDYALTCFERFNFFKASGLVFIRLISCRPFCKKAFHYPAPETERRT